MENDTATTPDASPEVAAADAPYSMDQAVEALLKRDAPRSPAKDDAPAEQKAEAPPEPVADEPPPDTEQAPEADAQDAPETTAEPEYEFDLAGHKFKLSKDSIKDELPKIQAKAKELEAGSTRKFQEAAEARKQAEQFQALGGQNVDLFAEARSLHAELQQLQSVDFNALTDSDPVQAVKLQTRYMQLQARNQQVRQAIEQSNAQLEASRNEQRSKAVAEVTQYAKTSIKGWTPELDKALGQYVTNNAVRPDSVQALTSDPRLYEFAVKAYKYDALQAARPVVEKKVAAVSPTVKPNSAANTVSAPQVRAKDAMAKLTKSGRIDDAVSAYIALQKVKR